MERGYVLEVLVICLLYYNGELKLTLYLLFNLTRLELLLPFPFPFPLLFSLPFLSGTSICESEMNYLRIKKFGTR